MKFTFHPNAKAEFDNSIDYYENRKSGLGREFADEIYEAIGRILQFPKAHSPLSSNSRRCLVSRFPYGLIYQIRDSDILIVAVMHLNREPKYWQGRIS